jgi:hypothetical protein
VLLDISDRLDGYTGGDALGSNCHYLLDLIPEIVGSADYATTEDKLSDLVSLTKRIQRTN